jgi:hypothetical protein
MTNSATILDPQPQLGGDVLEHIQGSVRAAALWKVVHRPSGKCAFSKRAQAALESLKKLESDLGRWHSAHAEEEVQSDSQKSVALELRSSSRLLRSAILAVSTCPEEIARLPRVILSDGQDEPRAATAAALYLAAVDGDFSESTFRTFMNALQDHEPFNVDELWYMAAFLRFTLVESLLDETRALLRESRSASVSAFLVRLKTLRTITNADHLVFLIESLIVFDATLNRDPAGAYARMEFESRQLYRKRVAFVAYHSDCTESQVAQAALDLASQHNGPQTGDPRIEHRRAHVGYYLLDKGFAQLAERVGFLPSVAWRMRQFVRAWGEDFYISGIQVLTVLFIAAALFPVLPHFSSFVALLIAFCVLLLPATQDAVDLVNNTVTAFFEPDPLPRLDFSKGIPQECTTLVVVPSLLLNEKQVRELVTDLEIRFLANRDPNLHCALLTDLPDSVSKPRDRDSHALVELAIRLIDELNVKYSSPRNGFFLLLHRHRIFNNRQGVWMGWERKRGKLLDLNRLLAGEFDAFPIKAGRIEVLPQVRYILTLDADTQLPRGAAAQLTGAIAHPLNQAVIDPKLRIVTAGYGILQPRLGITVQSAARSRLATIYSGQNGFDIYTRAVSDAYQDLFGEGIFTGKGIYEVATLHAVLNHRFPRNSLLSHDLIEGAYARAGLVTDIEVIDDYPSHYSAYSRRKHRWVRGDWQIVQWMFSRVPDEAGHYGPNPISGINRWKIFDNLRRSLVEPFLMALFVAGWLGLPGGPLYWTIIPLLLLILPTVIQLAFGIGHALASGEEGRSSDAISGFWHAALVALLNLVFLPHQTLLAFDAIIRSLVRRFITGERLLEWETAAQAESKATNTTTLDRYLAIMPLVATGLAVLIWYIAPLHRALYFALPILLLWSLAGVVTAWLNLPPREWQPPSAADEAFLLKHALRIWRYFCQFGGERHNYLIPDNVEEDGLYEAARVSPTNIGLLLNARQAACELGFLTTPEFAALTSRSLATIARLEKYRGHLYNWYDTQTLQPLNAEPFVSSVDSGNLVASLYTLHAGAQELTRNPLFSPQLFHGLAAHWRLLRLQTEFTASLTPISLPGPSAPTEAWIEWMPLAEIALKAAADSVVPQPDSAWWIDETRRRMTAILDLLCEYLPWMLPAYRPLCEFIQLGPEERNGPRSIEDAILFAEILDVRLVHAWDSLAPNPELLASGEKLRGSLPAAIHNLRNLVTDLRQIAKDAERLAEDTEFAFLIDPRRQILSIGYDMGKHQLHEACYDMIASEARIATFLAITRGDLPQHSWAKLARDHTYAYGHFLLSSWTGTMFEYLMPSIWMRSYHGTLIARTEASSVCVQRAFARTLNIPWGISESASARKDDAGHYHYQAFGVPRIALSADATAGPVVSPYSTFLALGVDTCEALRNLHRMASAGWVGAYGFYEAADYTGSLRKPALAREWMAHHQGMSLLAILNLLHNHVVQRWFHANPPIRATELLLHEIAESKVVLRARLKEFPPAQN